MKVFNLVKKGIIATTALSGVLVANSAFAIPYGTDTVYKAMGTNGQTEVYVSSAAGSRVNVLLGATDRPQARIAGACGEVRISVPSTGSFAGLKVDDVTVDAATLLTQTLPSCISGSFAEPRTANFKTPTGQIVIVGKTVGNAVKITLPQETTRAVTVNACGFGVLRGSTTSPLPANFTIGTQNYTLASVANATNGPICRTNGAISTGYVPAAWP
jgi:hypothetical protein